MHFYLQSLDTQFTLKFFIFIGFILYFAGFAIGVWLVGIMQKNGRKKYDDVIFRIYARKIEELEGELEKWKKK